MTESLEAIAGKRDGSLANVPTLRFILKKPGGISKHIL
jgi:hypothetical protein